MIEFYKRATRTQVRVRTFDIDARHWIFLIQEMSIDHLIASMTQKFMKIEYSMLKFHENYICHRKTHLFDEIFLLSMKYDQNSAKSILANVWAINAIK